jgi:WD40 repeat protein
VAAGGSKNIYRLCLISGALMNTLEGHISFVYHCVVFKNDSRIVSGSGDDTVRVWKIESPQCDCLYQIQVKNVSALVVSLDNTRIFSTSWVTSGISVWDGETGECMKILDTGEYCSRDCIVSVDDNQCLGSVNANGEVKLWKITTGQCTKTYSILDRPNKCFCIAYLSSTRFVWWSFLEGEVGVYDLQNETNIYTIRLKVRFVSVSPDGKYLIIVLFGENDKLLFTNVYSLETGKLK